MQRDITSELIIKKFPSDKEYLAGTIDKCTVPTSKMCKSRICSVCAKRVVGAKK